MMKKIPEDIWCSFLCEHSMRTWYMCFLSYVLPYIRVSRGETRDRTWTFLSKKKRKEKKRKINNKIKNCETELAPWECSEMKLPDLFLFQKEACTLLESVLSVFYRFFFVQRYPPFTNKFIWCVTAWFSFLFVFFFFVQTFDFWHVNRKLIDVFPLLPQGCAHPFRHLTRTT